MWCVHGVCVCVHSVYVWYVCGLYEVNVITVTLQKHLVYVYVRRPCVVCACVYVVCVCASVCVHIGLGSGSLAVCMNVWSVLFMF